MRCIASEYVCYEASGCKASMYGVLQLFPHHAEEVGVG